MVMLIGIIFLPGCRSTTPPVAFYALSSIRQMGGDHEGTYTLKDAVIGIGPAQFPDYLNRPQIVTRSGPNKLNMSEFNRWGGKLEQDFLATLGENLSILLSTDNVMVFPWKGHLEPDYRIALDIQQFEGQDDHTVLLNATWVIRGKEDGPTPLHISRSFISQPVAAQSYDALVAGYSEAVAALSREIAASIIKIRE
jgi:uncharacterized lipoprotein YmbA